MGEVRDMRKMQGCCERITVWRRAENGTKNYFEREVLKVLCCWKRKAERRLAGTGFAGKSTVGIIIPYIPGFMITPGDLVALGEHEREITGIKPFRESDIKAELGSDIITVQSVIYNVQGRGEHLRVEGA
jgi:hypothetical protein